MASTLIYAFEDTVNYIKDWVGAIRAKRQGYVGVQAASGGVRDDTSGNVIPQGTSVPNDLVIAGFTIDFGVTRCEIGDEDMNLKTIFVHNEIRNISLWDFLRIMNCNPKGFCYIKCLDQQDQETMIGVVHEYYLQKLETCREDKVLELKKELFSGGMSFLTWMSLMETNIYLRYNYDIFYKLGNKVNNKNYIYAVKLTRNILRNEEYETKKLILSFNHIENADGKFIETLEMELDIILGPLMYFFENSDVDCNKDFHF